MKLDILGKLDKKIPGKEYSKYTYMDIIELIDVRIYKTKGTDPRAEISRVASEMNKSWTDEEIRDWLIDYNRSWLSKGAFESNIRDWAYGNQALVHIFTKYSEKLQGRSFSLTELKELEKLSPTIEHILSQEPKFSFRSLGFKNSDEFEEYENTLGNLSLVEKSINSAAQNKNPIEKVPNYDLSKYQMTKVLASSISTGKSFTKQNIKDRTNEISEYIMHTWWC